MIGRLLERLAVLEPAQPVRSGASPTVRAYARVAACRRLARGRRRDRRGAVAFREPNEYLDTRLPGIVGSARRCRWRSGSPSSSLRAIGHGATCASWDVAGERGAVVCVASIAFGRCAVGTMHAHDLRERRWRSRTPAGPRTRRPAGAVCRGGPAARGAWRVDARVRAAEPGTPWLRWRRPISPAASRRTSAAAGCCDDLPGSTDPTSSPVGVRACPPAPACGASAFDVGPEAAERPAGYPRGWNRSSTSAASDRGSSGTSSAEAEPAHLGDLGLLAGDHRLREVLGLAVACRCPTRTRPCGCRPRGGRSSARRTVVGGRAARARRAGRSGRRWRARASGRTASARSSSHRRCVEVGGLGRAHHPQQLDHAAGLLLLTEQRSRWRSAASSGCPSRRMASVAGRHRGRCSRSRRRSRGGSACPAGTRRRPSCRDGRAASAERVADGAEEDRDDEHRSRPG